MDYQNSGHDGGGYERHDMRCRQCVEVFMAADCKPSCEKLWNCAAVRTQIPFVEPSAVDMVAGQAVNDDEERR